MKTFRPEPVRNFLKLLPLGAFLPLALAMASVGPDDAVSNLSKWARFFGLDNLPSWLIAKSADREVPLYIVGLSIIYAATVWGIPFYRRAMRAPSTGAKPDSSVKWAQSHLVAAGIAEDGSNAIWIALRQAARNGEIAVWGRPGANSGKPHEKIPPKHWRDFDFDRLRCLELVDDGPCETKSDGHKNDNRRYGDLRVSKTQIEQRWHVPERHSR